MDLPTDRSTIMVDTGGENIIVSGVACAQAFEPLKHTGLALSIRAQDIVLMQGNLRPDITAECLQLAKASGATTLFNPSPLTPGSGSALSKADIVILNEGEVVQISGKANPLHAAYDLIARGAGTVIVTLGGRGCLVVGQTDGDAEHVVAPRVPVLDTSGAGDVFCGSVAGCLAQGIALKHAVRIASAAAGLSVGRNGTMESCPSRQEMTHLINMELENA
jgi:ribokinase